MSETKKPAKLTKKTSGGKKKVSRKAWEPPRSYCYKCGHTFANIDGCPYCNTNAFTVGMGNNP